MITMKAIISRSVLLSFVIISSTIISSIIISSTATAQTQAFSCLTGGKLTGEQGRTLLEKVQARYSQIESLEGSFKQDSYVAALDEGEVSSGEMIFAKPGRMRWSYKQPREQEVVIRERELWLYQIDKQQILIDDIGQVLLSNLPVSFMMGIGNLSRDFELKGACRGAEGVVLTLSPQPSNTAADQKDSLDGFELLIDEAQNLPKGAKIKSLGGNVTAIIFDKLRVGSGSIDALKFVLEYPKGVDVMDRRIH